MTQYADIYKMFLNKISDVKLLSLSDDEITKMLEVWMESAINKLKECESDLSQRDSDLQCFKLDLSTTEKEMIAVAMVSEWLEPQINNTTLTEHAVYGKEEKFFAPSNLLNQLIQLHEKNSNRARKLARDYTYQSFLNSNLR